MRELIKSFAGTLAAVVGITGLVSCGGAGSPTSLSAAPNAYHQIERLARPAVKELFQNYQAHDTTNRATPYADPTLPGAINSFMTGVAGRSPAIANAVQGVLIPDEIAADLSQTATTSAYLGVETGGFTGNKFGGRGLLDPVIDISLGVVFGGFVPALFSTIPDDKKESPCLTVENVPAQTGLPSQVAGANSQYATPAQIGAANGETSTFPYLGAPH